MSFSEIKGYIGKTFYAPTIASQGGSVTFGDGTEEADAVLISTMEASTTSLMMSVGFGTTSGGADDPVTVTYDGTHAQPTTATNTVGQTGLMTTYEADQGERLYIEPKKRFKYVAIKNLDNGAAANIDKVSVTFLKLMR